VSQVVCLFGNRDLAYTGAGPAALLKRDHLDVSPLYIVTLTLL